MASLYKSRIGPPAILYVWRTAPVKRFFGAVTRSGSAAVNIEESALVKRV